MSSNVVEHEVLVDAPIDLVWDVVTKPEHVRQWFGADVDLIAEPGASGELRFSRRDNDEQVVLRAVVDRVLRPHLYELHWTGHPSEPVGDHPWTQVSFSFSSEGDGTRLRVTETGFEHVGLKGEAAESYRQGHVQGWNGLIDSLSAYTASIHSGVA